MAKFIISGGRQLKGEIRPQGNKNSVLKIMAAALLTHEECLIENAPKISDVLALGEILKEIGVRVEGLGTDILRIQARDIKNTVLPPELVAKLRASVVLMGPLLARNGEVSFRHPGGCVLGRRAIGTHFDVVRSLGGEVEAQGENYYAKMRKPGPASIFLDEVSVTATENALLLASSINGETEIRDAACEPHVQELCDVLEEMGAKVSGQGSNLLKITGVQKLKGFHHRIWPDHIDVGTLAIAAAVTAGQIEIKEIRPQDLEMILLYLSRFGVQFKIKGSTLSMLPSKLVAPLGKIQTRPWPGFPTDLMSALIILATQAQGTTLCHDWMYESRLFFVDSLITMGANITICDPHRVLVNGPTVLRAKNLSSPDIRAGVALLVAALCAKGESVIDNIEMIDRGYEKIDERLALLGADIKRVS
ncbi:UDP-N-acetylglucosamine 1-carboxyvinyltransferase [Candidatus Shapirobacteria bacterium]|nr:UDP-N-acetylglucosamine 1-carboxyvinyltransferase [Candidatus Shapirobacteria bacterium]